MRSAVITVVLLLVFFATARLIQSLESQGRLKKGTAKRLLSFDRNDPEQRREGYRALLVLAALFVFLIVVIYILTDA